MKTITATRTAIDFLNAEKKKLHLEVSDHMDVDKLYRFNREHSGNESFETVQDLDWDEFYFKLKMTVNFDFSSTHERPTSDYPGYEEIEYTNPDGEIEITECGRWDAENEEFQDYRLSVTERKDVVKYLSENIELY